MRTALLLCAVVLSIGGCDANDEIVPVPDVMLVHLVPQGLRLVTESYSYCEQPIYIGTRAEPGVLYVEVIGAERIVGAQCRAALAASATVSIPETPLDVRIRHRGRTDRYRITSGAAGHELVAVETSTTRLGPR